MSDETSKTFNVENEMLALSITANAKDKDHFLVFTLGEQAATLSALASLDLLQWLYERQETLYELASELPPVPEPVDITVKLKRIPKTPRLDSFQERLQDSYEHPAIRLDKKTIAKSPTPQDVSLADMFPDDLEDDFYKQKEG